MQTETMVRRAKNGDKDALVRLIMDRKQEYYKLAFGCIKPLIEKTGNRAIKTAGS